MALTKAEMKYLLSLHTKKGRKQTKRFLAEGVRLLEESLVADYLPSLVYYSPSDLTVRGEELVRRFVAHKVSAQSISARECHRLSDTGSSQGVLAVFARKSSSLEQQLRLGYRRILICDRIGDPGNLGTLIRSAAAFQFQLVVTTADSAESVNPKAIRASMGAIFKIPIVDGAEDAEVASRVKKAGYTLYSADIRGKGLDRAVSRAAKIALVIGSEPTGAGAALTAAADMRIRIPMAKGVESLNSAMAGTVLMFWFNARERVDQ